MARRAFSDTLPTHAFGRAAGVVRSLSMGASQSYALRKAYPARRLCGELSESHGPGSFFSRHCPQNGASLVSRSDENTCQKGPSAVFLLRCRTFYQWNQRHQGQTDTRSCSERPRDRRYEEPHLGSRSSIASAPTTWRHQSGGVGVSAVPPVQLPGRVHLLI